VSNTELRAIVPATAVDGPITVTNAGGSTTSADSFAVSGGGGGGGGGGTGTIVPAHEFSGGTDVDASSFVTQSWTPQANRLYLLSLAPVQDFGQTQPTVTGNGLTWVPITGGEFGGQGSGRQLWVFRALGSAPTSGPIRIDFGGKSQFTIAWSLDRFGGVDTSGTNGSAAVVQHVDDLWSGSSTSLQFSLAPLASPNDLAFGLFGHAEHENTVPGGGWTELSDFGPNTTPITIQLQTEYRVNTTSVSASWASFNTGGGIGLELHAG